MKKVLICIGQLFGGGAERVVSIWSKQLAEAGFSSNILIYGHADNEYSISNEVSVYAIKEKYEDYKKLSACQRIIKIRNRIKEINPDVVISFLPRMQVSVMLATLGLRVERIETIRNNPWKIKHNSIIEERLWKKCLESADALIVQTNGQKEYISKRNRKNCYVIPNPVAPEYVHNKKKQYVLPIRRFVAVGRITEQKNYPLMIQAFSKVVFSQNEDITLDIYGSGSDESLSTIQKIIDEYRMTSKITLRGKVNNLYAVLHDYDAFLMTSNFEGMPNALVEAMATGLVCISTDCATGPKDLIHHGESGFLASTGDVNSVVEQIVAALNLNPVAAKEMGRSAMNFITDYCGEQNSRDKLVHLLME